jgi:hypothetical protein
MAALTLAQMRTRVARRFGGRTDLNTEIDDAINDSIQMMEEGTLMPFFLRKDTNDSANLVTVADQQHIVLPTDFLIEHEDGGFFRNDTSETVVWQQLEKDDFDALNNNADLQGTGKPTKYAIAGVNIYLFPIPDAVYTVRAIYNAAQDALSADGDTNGWTNYAPTLIINMAVERIAQEHGYTRQRDEARLAVTAAEDRLRRYNTARAEQGQNATMGE